IAPQKERATFHPSACRRLSFDRVTSRARRESGCAFPRWFGGWMTNDAELRAAVRQAVEAGRLPDRRPDRTWGGRGGGDRCAICTSLVRREEAELELEFVQPDGRLDVYAVHARCFALWEIERQ